MVHPQPIFSAASRKSRLIQTGEFEAENHWYPKALNATIHPMVSFFMNLKQEHKGDYYMYILISPNL